MTEIPKVGNPKKYDKVCFTHSDFIQITSNDRFDVQMQYPLLGMKFAESSCYVRKEVHEKLVDASNLLPKGYRLRIWDAWRPFALQHELYTSYSEKIVNEFGLEKRSEEEKKTIIRKFVSEPVENRNLPPVHTTGGAIDVTIIDSNGKEIDMGTEFDAFTDLTHTAAFENQKNLTVRDNRRMLYQIMTSVGFTNLPSEWWHYDYGDRFWAYYNNKPAMYDGIFVREEIYG